MQRCCYVRDCGEDCGSWRCCGQSSGGSCLDCCEDCGSWLGCGEDCGTWLGCGEDCGTWLCCGEDCGTWLCCGEDCGSWLEVVAVVATPGVVSSMEGVALLEVWDLIVLYRGKR